jgi:ABC-type phosphate/phosphonate transport system substrate-binding protein
MSRSVSLAMYDPGDGAIGRLWSDLRAHLAELGFADLPGTIEQPSDYDAAWLADDLLLAQTCGYPLKHALSGRVRYVGTPVYDVDGTEGAYYRSALVVRADDTAEALQDLRGRRAAFNSGHSQSGYNALRDAASVFAENGHFFAAAIATGGHTASLRAVIDGTADVAAIDPVSLALQPAEVLNAIKIIGWTAATPGLPFITSLGTTDDELVSLREALAGFLAGIAPDRHAAFRFAGFEVLPPDAYDSIIAMERRAIDRSYPLLA